MIIIIMLIIGNVFGKIPLPLGYVHLLYLHAFFAICFTAPPTLDDITKKLCPPDKPYKCLRYGKCYGVDSYCHSDSGTVESCFPDSDLTEDKKKSWCRQYGLNVTFMKDETCSLACSSILLADLSKLINSSCPDASPHVCPPDGHCYNSSQYCQQGTVKSCFPNDAMPDLLNWCKSVGQYNVSLMKDKSCYLACQARFSTSDLAPSDGNISSAINGISKQMLTEGINVGLLVALIIAIILSVVGPILCCILRRNKKIQKWYRKISRSNTATGSSPIEADNPPNFTADEIPVKAAEKKNLLRLDIDKPTVFQRQNSKPGSPLSPKVSTD